MTPRRIQRQRTRGWRMPEDAVYVGRPSKWGNWFAIGDELTLTTASAGGTYGGVNKFVVVSNLHAVTLFRNCQAPSLAALARRELAGKDLACWCPLDQPCHGDVLLELANP